VDANDMGLLVERDHQELLPGQDLREPFVNSNEHGATIFVADVEKVAASTLTDPSGLPVLRQTYTDNGEGIPSDKMPTYLRQYGRSSKASDVFSGNHGMGLILANGVDNPAGLAVLTKTADADEPYMAYLWKNPDTGHYALRTFWVGTEEDGEWLSVTTLDTFDGINWKAVWEAAYDNVKFNGTPESGTVIVECGVNTHNGIPCDSTYVTASSPGGRYTRWAFGNFINSRFWEFGLDAFWGVPQPGSKSRGGTFTIVGDKKTGEAIITGIPDFSQKNEWGYITATGMKRAIYSLPRPSKRAVKDDEDDALGEDAQMEFDSVHIDGPFPATIEVYLRTPPPGVDVSGLNFPVRQRGKIFIDYNGEVFEHPDPQTAHAVFAMTHPELRANVWVRIIPDILGVKTPGAVWMPSGRKDLNYITADGTSRGIPWRELGQAFKHPMPRLIVEAIKRLDATPTDLTTLRDKKMQRWWEKVAGSLKVRRPVTKTVEVPTFKIVREIGGLVEGEPGGTPRKTGVPRGPVKNPGAGSHAAGGVLGDEIGTRRRAPGRRVETGTKTEKQTVDDDTPDSRPKPPMYEWVEDPEKWGTEAKWGVMYDDPSDANAMRGKVWLNWNHWYVQQKYEDLAGEKGPFAHAPNKVKQTLQELFAVSAITKIGHRRNECRNRALGITDEEVTTIFSPPALTGFLLGVWDHEQRIMSSLGGSLSGTAASDADEPEAS
jgi:hypothetical protein